MPNYIKLGNLRIEIPEANNNGGGGGGGGEGLLSGLLAFYNLSDLTDASGNGNTLTNNGGVTFSSGKIGNAAVFSEPEQSLERLIPLAVGPKSFSFWFRRSAQISGGGYSNYTYLLLNFNEGTPNAALTMRDDGTLMEISNTVNYNDDIWHHYCASITTGATTQYIDGSIVQNEGAFFTADTASDKTALRNSLGFANGNIDLDAVGIWSRALTSAEVTELYNAGTGKEHPFA